MTIARLVFFKLPFFLFFSFIVLILNSCYTNNPSENKKTKEKEEQASMNEKKLVAKNSFKEEYNVDLDWDTINIRYSYEELDLKKFNSPFIESFSVFDVLIVEIKPVFKLKRKHGLLSPEIFYLTLLTTTENLQIYKRAFLIEQNSCSFLS